MIDISASMRAHSSPTRSRDMRAWPTAPSPGPTMIHLPVRRPPRRAEPVRTFSKILFHTMIDKTLVFELSHAVGLLAFGKEVLADGNHLRIWKKLEHELGCLTLGSAARGSRLHCSCC